MRTAQTKLKSSATVSLIFVESPGAVEGQMVDD